MTLEEHLAAGGTCDLARRDDGKFRDPVDGSWSPAFLFDLHDGQWRGEKRRAAANRAEAAAAAAVKAAIPAPWDVARRNAYLSAWPMHRQLEALGDAANGDTTKLDQMTEDFAAIKASHPKPA